MPKLPVLSSWVACNLANRIISHKQQPHLIYLAELLYRANPSEELLKKYNSLIQETAEFMYSFATYEEEHDRYVLKGAIPAQETLRAAETVNPPFELSYWHFAMQVAQTWRERTGMERVPEWDVLIEKLSPLAYNDEQLYLAAETAVDTYKDIRFTSDHMAVTSGLLRVTSAWRSMASSWGEVQAANANIVRA
jgi:hypothetical protein